MEDNIKSSFNFVKIFEYCLLALLLLLPIIFIPSIFISLYSAKIALLSVVLIVFIGAFLADTISKGKIVFLKSKILVPISIFPIIAIISSFFSGVTLKSLVGEVFELGTSSSFLILVLLMFIALFGVRNLSSGIKAIHVFLLSSFVVLLHLILRIFSNYLLPDVVALRIPNFLVGSPADTSIFLGASVIAYLSILNYSELTRRNRYIIYILSCLSMLFIAAIGFKFVILLVGLFTLIHFIYTLSWSVNQNDLVSTKGFSSLLPYLFILILSVVFVLSPSRYSLSGFLANTMKINVVEVRPDIATTFNLVAESWKINPVTGVGANMFSEIWNMNKPLNINNTQFWNTNFTFGSGFIPTIAVTTGILGFVSILIFMGMFIKYGLNYLFSSYDKDFKLLSSTTFFVALFLWIIACAYSGGISIIALTFLFTGLFLASLSLQQVIITTELNIFKNPRSNFVSVFIIVVLLIGSVVGGYFIWERIVASYLFNKGLVNNAIRVTQTDTYWRAFSETTISEIGSIVNSSSGALTETQKAALQRAVADSVSGVQMAINWNPKNFQNWFAMGRVYEILASNGLQGALENSRENYNEALKRAPSNPSIYLALGRLYALAGDYENARAEIIKSIEMKNNYTDAYFTLAQLEVATNNVDGAIKSVEAATLINPTNSSLVFQLGLLKYNKGDFNGAESAFIQAVSLTPDYANARYFLGLVQERLGKKEEAITQFEEIKKTNQDNTEIDLILSNLRAGRSPFSNIKLPVDDKPENRVAPPIEGN